MARGSRPSPRRLSCGAPRGHPGGPRGPPGPAGAADPPGISAAGGSGMRRPLRPRSRGRRSAHSGVPQHRGAFKEELAAGGAADAAVCLRSSGVWKWLKSLRVLTGPECASGAELRALHLAPGAGPATAPGAGPSGRARTARSGARAAETSKVPSGGAESRPPPAPHGPSRPPPAPHGPPRPLAPLRCGHCRRCLRALRAPPAIRPKWTQIKLWSGVPAVAVVAGGASGIPGHARLSAGGGGSSITEREQHIPTHPSLSHPIPTHTNPPQPTPTHPNLSHPIPSQPTPTHPIPSHPNLSHPIPTHPKTSQHIPAHANPSQHIPIHANQSQPMLTHPIPCQPIPIHSIPNPPNPY